MTNETMIINDGSNDVTVNVEFEQILNDGSVYRVVTYDGYVFCRFALLEYASGDLYCQSDWQSNPVAVNDILNNDWFICNPVDL